MIHKDQKFSDRMNTAAKARAEMLAKAKARAEAAKATADDRAKERAAIAQGLSMGFTTIGRTCAAAGVSPLAPAEYDMAQMRRKGLV